MGPHLFTVAIERKDQGTSSEDRVHRVTFISPGAIAVYDPVPPSRSIPLLRPATVTPFEREGSRASQTLSEAFQWHYVENSTCCWCESCRAGSRNIPERSIEGHHGNICWRKIVRISVQCYRGRWIPQKHALVVGKLASVSAVSRAATSCIRV